VLQVLSNEFTSSDGSSSVNRDVASFELLVLAIASLMLFVQHEYCGPPSLADDDAAVQSRNNAQLTVDGEVAFATVKHSSLLLFALTLLAHPLLQSNATLRSASWWRARALFVHQQHVTGKELLFVCF
jgi:hypothetical protein